MQSEWREVSLGEIGKVVTGKTPLTARTEFFGGDVPFITPRDMAEEKYIRATERTLTGEGVQSVRGSAIPKDSIVVSCIGSDMGKAAIADRLSVTNQQINSLVVNESATAEFVYYSLKTRKQELLNLAGGGSALPILNKGHFSKVKIKLPPLPEQKAIARVLGSLDDKIELNRRMNATLEQMAQTLFRAWFVDFEPVKAKAAGLQPVGMDAETAALFPSEFESSTLGPIPKGWEFVPLNTVYEIYDSRRIPLSKGDRNLRRGIYPYYGAADVMDYIDDFLFNGVYLLLGEDGSVLQKDNTPVLQYVWGKFWVNNHAHVLQGALPISTEHLMLALKEKNIAAYITGAVQLKLNQGNLGRIPFLKPTDQIASAFSEIITPLYNKFRNNAEQSQTLSQIRDALLPRLISGQLRVPEAMREVENVL